MKSCLVGVVSWCDSSRFPQRFEVFKKSVLSLEKFIPRKICTTVIVDNNSSEDVKTFIESSSFFDKKILLPENTQDVGAYAILARIAQDEKIPYLWIFENDYILYRKDVLEDAISFLQKHTSCGYMRMQKFELGHPAKYDKQAKDNVDKENAVWMKNIIDNTPVKFSKPYKTKKRNYFYISNFHFGLHGGIISTKIWDKIFPKMDNLPYYYKLEKQMRDRYHTLHKKTAVLDNGAFSMESSSVYQPLEKSVLTKTIDQLLKGLPGGYIHKSIVDYYCDHYEDFKPIQIQLFGNSLGIEELGALDHVFESHWLGYGQKSKEFEQKFKDMIGSKYAFGLSSCTGGLFMSMEMIGLKKGDEVIIPTIGFVACANAVVALGAKAIFADVDKQTLNMRGQDVEKVLTNKTKAVILLHYGGIPCDIEGIQNVIKSKKQKIFLIEDSANSIKSLYKDKYCGTFGDIGVFSFDVNKILSTGSGGMLVTDSEELAYKAAVARFHGLKPGASSGYDAMRARQERWWEIELEHHGNRYIINDITASIGIEQLNKIDGFITRRKKIWEKFNRGLRTIPFISIPPTLPKSITNSYYFYWVRVPNEEYQLSLAHYLVQNGIYTTFRYYPLHKISYYKSKQKLPNSEYINKTTLNLPFHQNLSDHDVDRIIETIRQWSKRQKKSE